MSSSPQVSIVMNCRNSSEFLREAIQSVYDQTFTDWEIIFFDTCSTDDSPQIAQSFDHRLKYFRTDTPLSLGAGRNEALRKCNGRLIAFLDCDDIWFPQKLEKQVSVFDRDPTVTFCYSNYVNWYFLSGREADAHAYSGRNDNKKGDLFGENLHDYHVGILTAMFRADLLSQLDHWFDPKLSLAEDLDFFLRIMMHVPHSYLREPLAKYRIHKNNYSNLAGYQWVEELEYVFGKISKSVPEFSSRYGAQSEGLLGRIAYMKAKLALLAGKNRDAREILKPYRHQSSLNFKCYLTSFLPNSLWAACYHFYLNRIR